MRPLAYVVVLAALLSVLAIYLVWTDGRLDRLGSRVQGAWSALDAQLVRRSAVAGELAAYCRRHALGDAARNEAMEDAAVAAQIVAAAERERAENVLSKAVRAAVAEVDRAEPLPAKAELLRAALVSAATRVGLARQFYNDAVRDLRGLRRRRIAGVLARTRGLGASAAFFEIDDTAIDAGAHDGV